MKYTLSEVADLIENTWGKTDISHWLRKQELDIPKELYDERDKMLIRVSFDDGYRAGFMDYGKPGNVNYAWKDSISYKRIKENKF